MSWDLIGHDWAVGLLRQHLRSGRVRHAYLFTGPQGVGMRTLALRFAQALNCTLHAGSGEMCSPADQCCRSCQLTRQAAHPDLHILPIPGNRSGLRIDQVRELQHQLALAPFEGRWRIALLPEFHLASHAAANALLKTLEEPASAVILLLTAPRAEQLLPTIVSRCEQIGLRALPAAQLAAALERRGEPAERARLLAGIAGGRPGVALRLADDDAILQRRQDWLDDLLRLLVGDRRARFAYVHQWSRQKSRATWREEAAEALENWLSFWRDAMLAASGSEGARGNPDRDADLLQVQQLGISAVLHALQRTEATLQALEHNANLQLALETLMLDLPWVGNGG